MLQRLQDRLDTVGLPLGVDELNLHRDGRSMKVGPGRGDSLAVVPFPRAASRTRRAVGHHLTAATAQLPRTAPHPLRTARVRPALPHAIDDAHRDKYIGPFSGIHKADAPLAPSEKLAETMRPPETNDSPTEPN